MSCYNCYDQTKINLSLSNKKTGKDIKDLYLRTCNKSNDKYKLRLINRGFEILDEHVLSTHKFNKDFQVQVLMKEIIDD